MRRGLRRRVQGGSRREWTRVRGFPLLGHRPEGTRGVIRGHRSVLPVAAVGPARDARAVFPRVLHRHDLRQVRHARRAAGGRRAHRICHPDAGFRGVGARERVSTFVVRVQHHVGRRRSVGDDGNLFPGVHARGDVHVPRRVALHGAEADDREHRRLQHLAAGLRRQGGLHAARRGREGDRHTLCPVR